MTTVAEDAYLAGILDGEGSISFLRRNTGQLVLRVEVGITNRSVIEWLHGRYGGTVRHDITSRANPHWTPSHQWVAMNRLARPALGAAFPYLIVKRQRATWALRVLEIQDARDPTGSGHYTPEQRFCLDELKALFDGDVAPGKRHLLRPY